MVASVVCRLMVCVWQRAPQETRHRICLILSVFPLSTHPIFIFSVIFPFFKKKITPSLFIIPANLDRSLGQRQITLSCISNLINLQPLEGITIPMNNYSNPVMCCQCQNVAITHHLFFLSEPLADQPLSFEGGKFVSVWGPAKIKSGEMQDECFSHQECYRVSFET